jgi:uncharacterized membrane protein
MYLLDPDRGARRRALVRDKSVHALHRAGQVFDKAARDVNYRAHGLAAEGKALLRHEEVPDDLLVQRVRSQMGRACSHPHAVQVSAQGGEVTLRGPILAGEVSDLLACVERIAGVRHVRHELEPHAKDEQLPALQGERRGPGGPARWTPTARIAAGAAAAGLVGWGLARRDRVGTAIAALGAGLLARDVADRPLYAVLGIGAGTRAVDFHKTIHVRRKLEDVFSFFANVENFPKFMAHVREVNKVGDGRYRWVASGPAGIPVSWTGEITEFVPNKVIAWRSEPGAAIGNAGVAHFEPNPDGTTRLDLRMSYNPPAGALGHLVAALFGCDPKHALDQDMVRFQSLLEKGKTTAHGAEVHWDEVAPSGVREIVRPTR